MARVKNILHQKFDRLLVIEQQGVDKYGNATWKCLCDCGKYSIVAGRRLRSGHTRSCGCKACPTKDLTGMRFGRLVINGIAERPPLGRQSHWTCKCDCGKLVVKPGSSLRNGMVQSCGCLRIDRVKEANTLSVGESARHRILRSYIYQAKKRGLSWCLSEADFYSLLDENCFYCDHPPRQIIKEAGGSLVYNGIDRIDNEKGYTSDNTVACCKQCNYAKRNQTQKEFIDMALRIAKKFKVQM
jgi:hypothetical protein